MMSQPHQSRCLSTEIRDSHLPSTADDTDASSIFRSSSPETRFEDQKDVWKEGSEPQIALSFEECEGLQSYADEARERGDVREAFLAYSVW